MNKLLVSVSGVRGIVEESFTRDLVRSWVSAYATLLKEKKKTATFVIGRDTRPSGAWALDVAARTLRAHGVAPITLGTVPTPTVGLAVRHHHADGGLIITGSHNPGEWNALKFLGSDGVFLSADEMNELARRTETPAEKTTADNDNRAEPQQDDAAIARHVERVLTTLPLDAAAIRARGFRIVADPVNGTGALAIPPLLDSLGCHGELINGDPSGTFAHPPEPTPEHLANLGSTVRDRGADLGIATDPDADRLVLVDETGTVLSEEYTVTLAALSLLSSLPETQRQTPIVVNLSTTRMVDDVARQLGTSTVRTAVGERHVVDGMRAHHAVVGGEGNGGVIVPASHEGRDALVGIALALHLLARGGTSLSRFAGTLPRYVRRKEKFPRPKVDDSSGLLDELRAAFPDAMFNTLDGIRVDTADGWVHVRQSNTEPVVRVIGEAATPRRLEMLLEQARKVMA